MYKYIDTVYEREIFVEVNFDVGKYYIVPRSEGVFLMKKIKKIEKNEEILNSIIDDIFNKLD